ncbi:hypothetical protein D3C72_2541530 [compost metagenome]
MSDDDAQFLRIAPLQPLSHFLDLSGSDLAVFAAGRVGCIQADDQCIVILENGCEIAVDVPVVIPVG